MESSRLEQRNGRIDRKLQPAKQIVCARQSTFWDLLHNGVEVRPRCSCHSIVSFQPRLLAVWTVDARQPETDPAGTIRCGTMPLSFCVIRLSYSFSSRFERKPESKPEELIAAAHAGCFTKIDDHHGSRKMDCLLLEMAGATFIARDLLTGGESVCVTY